MMFFNESNVIMHPVEQTTCISHSSINIYIKDVYVLIELVVD